MLPPDTTQNNPTSIIHHLQSCHFLWFFIFCATEFQGAHLPCSHVNFSAFLKHSTYLQGNEKIKLCSVAWAFVQIFSKWPAVQKVWPPCSMAYPSAIFSAKANRGAESVAGHRNGHGSARMRCIPCSTKPLDRTDAETVSITD